MDLQECKKLIADFMWDTEYFYEDRTHTKLAGIYNMDEKDAHTLNGKRYYGMSELRFHESWDWLMPVVEKIEKELSQEFRVVILEDECTIHLKNNESGELLINFRTIIESYETSKIEAVWLAVIKFILWYNQNKEQ